MNTQSYTRRHYLKIMGVGAVSMTPLRHLWATTKQKPNLLFILTDQQTLTAMSAYGNPYVHTPNMDAIAAQGVCFEKSYCAAPVCSPARSSLVSSRMPHETGFVLNSNGLQKLEPEIPTLGEIFRQAGYQTAWAGKWHLEPGVQEKGFEGLGLARDCFWITRQLGLCKEEYGIGSKSDPKVVDAVTDFLRQKHDRPFLLCASFLNPHDICRWIKEHPDPLKPPPSVDSFPSLPTNFAVTDEPEFVKWCREREKYGEELIYTKRWDDNQWQLYLNTYYRLVEEVDTAIGQVLTTLREQGLEDNTLIVFTSDHGEGIAAHHWVAKLMFYEEPMKVPFIVSWKGVTPAGVVNKTHLVSGVDLLPTLCDYAQIPIPAGIRGLSVRPWIENPQARGHDFIVAELQPNPQEMDMQGRMLRTQQYKYIAFSKGHQPEMLFDLLSDPGEMKNLANEPAMQSVLQDHRLLLEQWLKQTHDNFQRGQS